MATVVHVRLKKTRLRLVDHEDSIGIAKREPRGRAMGARSEDRDMFVIIYMEVGSL
jgi:hypothetical protein